MRQVLIEARIVEASDTFGRSLGVQAGRRCQQHARGDRHLSAASTGGGTATTVTNWRGHQRPSTSPTVAFPQFTQSNFVNLPSTGVAGNGNAAGTFAISLFNSSLSRMLNLEISALEADGKGKVVSSPRVVTADQTKALIEQGTELPYQVATSSGATSIAFRKANLKLEVTPQITPEGNIILTLDVNKDTVGPGDHAPASRSTPSTCRPRCWSRTAARWSSVVSSK